MVCILTLNYMLTMEPQLEPATLTSLFATDSRRCEQRVLQTTSASI